MGPRKKVKSMTGNVIAEIEYIDKSKEIIKFSNAVLTRGRVTLTKFLVEPQNIFISNMLFGDGGYNDGIKKTVDPERNSLFGVTRANKSVVAHINQEIPTQAIFTTVLTYQDANGYNLNEMALQLSNGDLFSMTTFPNLGKTDQMQIVWNWQIAN